MDKLVRVIGPAPSEMPFADLVERLRGERERMNTILFAPAPKRAARKQTSPKRASSKKVSKAQLENIARMTGISIEELMK